MKKQLFAALAVTLGLSATVRAQEEPPPPEATPAVPTAPPSRKLAGAAGDFGEPGQFVVGVDVPFQNEGAQFALIRSSVSMGGGTSTIVVIRPSVDYFVLPRVSIGGLLGYARGDVAFGDAGVSSQRSVTELFVGVRAGYDLRMTELVSIWGRVELIYSHTSGGASGYDLPVVVNAPILLHPATHFFLGAGPTFSRDLVAKVGGDSVPTTMNYGLQGIIGGTFGGG